MTEAQETSARTPKRRVLDIEDVLQWAVRDELPKRRIEGDGAVRRVSPMFSLCDFGVPIDNWSREPGFPIAMGSAPHPDALKIEAAVMALTRFHDLPIGDGLDLGPDFAAEPDAERKATEKAFKAIELTVISMAKLRSRPYWQSRPTLSKVIQPNGKPVVLRWETQFYPKFGGGEVAEDVLVPIAIERKNYYPAGAYCPLRFDQEPETILNERAEYLAWWAGLNALAEDLFDQLETIAVLPPSAAQKPWLGERELGKPPRIFEDLTARIYQKESRQTAAAHRALGQRRLKPGRRGMLPTPVARRPAAILASLMA